MSEMVERVARAICDSGAMDSDRTYPEIIEDARVAAKAAIAAMHEPTDAMVNAPPRPTLANCDEHHYAVAWQAMIDEALK